MGIKIQFTLQSTYTYTNNAYPAVRRYLVFYDKLATFWTTTFGAPDDAQKVRPAIQEVFGADGRRLAERSNLADVISTPDTWLYAAPYLYIHADDTTYTVGYATTYSTSPADGAMPYLKSVPRVSCKTDLINYNKIAYADGSAALNNADGHFNAFDLLGSTAKLFYDNTLLAEYYIKDYKINNYTLTVNLDDARRRFDVTVQPTYNYTTLTALEIVEDLLLNELNITYNSDNYDTVAWEAVKQSVDAVLTYTIDKEIALMEVIRQLQNGSTKRWRFNISPDGKITARLDDWEAKSVRKISNIEMLDGCTVETDFETLAGVYVVKYAGGELVYRDVEAYVLKKYHTVPTATIETYLQTGTDAEARAAWEANKRKDVYKIVSFTIKLTTDLQLYDIIDVETGIIGSKRVQITQLQPDYDKELIKISGVIVGDVPEIMYMSTKAYAAYMTTKNKEFMVWL